MARRFLLGVDSNEPEVCVIWSPERRFFAIYTRMAVPQWDEKGATYYHTTKGEEAKKSVKGKNRVEKSPAALLKHLFLYCSLTLGWFVAAEWGRSGDGAEWLVRMQRSEYIYIDVSGWKTLACLAGQTRLS